MGAMVSTLMLILRKYDLGEVKKGFAKGFPGDKDEVGGWL
jgi:hypothetical protein